MTENQNQIIEAVCLHYSQSKENILGKSRFSEYIHPRWICMYILFSQEKLTKKHIGRIFKSKHPTVIAAINKVKKDKELLYTANLLIHKIKDKEIYSLFCLGF